MAFAAWWVVAAVTFQAGPLQGQDAPLELTRLTAPLTLDGLPNEEAWSRVPVLPLTMYSPTFRGEPRQRTEIRVAYDDESLYVGARMYDDDPNGIRINSLYRDRWNGDDALAIYIDAFNDNKNAKWFGTTPGGIRFDLLVADDGATLNGSWDTFWDSWTRVTEDGWFAEVRIPFSSLGFQMDDEGRAVMGLTVTRLVSRTNERVTFPAIDPQFQFRQPSVAQDVVLRDVRSPTPLYVTPFVLSGVDQRPLLAEGATRFVNDEVVAKEIGVDVRFALSSTLTADLTVNTDFAQVEADDQQVNLGRFPLFFPEKRRFFQEASGIFDFTVGGGARLFHSRRIGLDASRHPVPVAAGARLVGRVGEWDLGALDMQTESSTGLPSENFAVLRARRTVFNPFSSLGVMATSRVNDETHNFAWGVDSRVRLFGDDYVTAKWVATTDSRDEPGVGLFDRSQVNLQWQRRISRGLAYNLEGVRSGEGFRPELGFLPRRDFTLLNIFSEYFVFTDDHPRFRRVWPGMLAFSTFRNADGALESGQYAVWLQWETKAGSAGWIEPKLYREDVLSGFLLGGEAEVPAGVYTFADLQLNASMPAGARLRAAIDLRAGSYFDGTRQQVTITPTWNVAPQLELGGDYQYSRLRFADRAERADIHVGRLRIRTALNARASGNAFVQYNSTTHALDFNLRLRYNFAEGTDLWVVYNEGLDTERLSEPGAVRPPLTTARSVILKYSQTFGR